jgi:hypothetical protein
VERPKANSCKMFSPFHCFFSHLFSTPYPPFILLERSNESNAALIATFDVPFMEGKEDHARKEMRVDDLACMERKTDCMHGHCRAQACMHGRKDLIICMINDMPINFACMKGKEELIAGKDQMHGAQLCLPPNCTRLQATCATTCCPADLLR